MSAEDDYAEAERRIAEAKDSGTTRLDLSGLKDLRRLPLDIIDLSALTELSLAKTQVSDIAPLRGLSALTLLDFTNTRVSDLRPIALTRFDPTGQLGFFGIRFRNSPAAHATTELTALSEILDGKERTKKTLAYLRSLPPWPQPWAPVENLRATLDPATPALQIATTTAHIAFILRTSRTSDAIARVAMDQTRAALNDVPVQPGSNRLPESLDVFEDMATVFDRLTDPLSDPDTPGAETALSDRIAELERIVSDLTAQLADETRRAETAEAALARNPNWTAYKAALAPKAADLTIWLTKAGVISGALHFLGASNPVMVRLLDLLSKF